MSDSQLELDIAVMATNTCQIRRIGLERLTCDQREARYRCEIIGPHSEHVIGEHTKQHERIGNGWNCDFKSFIMPFGDPFGLGS